ncbi:MAG TPA: nicotinate-nucleotide adenylyltransferase [Gemmatimonadaceae bacterium]|jgi:nicotinate-nucleotide adenylyltransferase|nr:nicotinate-nucleotide adenylyltransferase [Gemmatimonadaceae bacterium]
MRLGILGGSFDPPHVGHLLAASDAVDALGLDRLIFVPAAEQPLKRGGAHASGAQRLAMIHFAVDGDPRFGVSPVEIDRKGLSYTVDTLDAFAREFPRAERYFLIGADAFGLFAQWREPARVAALATIAVMRRAGQGAEDRTVPAGIAPDRVTWLETRLVDVSSTEIRERVRRGLPIRGFVAAAVADYIATAGLYREGTA